jgi:ABC-type transport system substrate-binding protein
VIHLCHSPRRYHRPGLRLEVFHLPSLPSWWLVLRRTSRRVAAVACLLTLAGGCDAPRQQTGAPGGATLTIGLPSRGVSLGPIVQSLTTEKLVGTAPNGRPIPGLIAEWSTSSDGLTWDLVVRADAQQHDGTPVTADDVARLLQAQADSGDTPAGLWDVDRIDPIDARTLRLQLRAPSSLLLEALTLTRALPVGPFVVGPDPDGDADRPVLLLNPRQTTPSTVARIAFRHYDSPRAAWSALLRNDIDFLYEVSDEARAFLERAPGIQVRSFIRPYVLTLGLNNRHPILRHTSVRRALNYAVDRQALLEKDYGGRGLAATGHAWPFHWAADGSMTPYPFDQQEARRLLDAAGLPVIVRQAGPSSRFRITCLVPARFERVARRLQQAYAAVGVDLDLELVAQEDLEPRLASGTFEAFLQPLLSGYDRTFLYQMWSGQSRGRFVDFGYTAAADAAERMRRAQSDEDVLDAFQAMQRVHFDDPPAVFLIWERTARAVGPRFEVPDERDRDILSTLTHWRRAAHADLEDP